MISTPGTATQCFAPPKPQPGPQAHPPTFSMRTKRRFCRKGMSWRRLRRARELLARIVLFGVEFGVEMDGASVSNSVSQSVNKIVVGPVVGGCAGRGAGRTAAPAAGLA